MRSKLETNEAIKDGKRVKVGQARAILTQTATFSI
jgi:hypothetical protein